MNSLPTRYHPALVALHWLLALGLVFALSMGTFSLDKLPNASPDKIGALRGHMIVGLAIGSLMLVRLITRLKTAVPPTVGTGSHALNLLGRLVHAGLYLAVFLMAASGAATAFLADLPQIVFFGSGQPLPEDFRLLLPRSVHGLMAKVLMALIGLHVLGALFHQFRLKDRLLSRMWFGSR